MGRLLSIWQLHESTVCFQAILGLQDKNIFAPETPPPQFWVQGISGQVLLWFLRPVRSSNQGSLGTECESIRMKIIGKPYSGKPNVRFDERELEIEHAATTPALYSTELWYLTSLMSQIKIWTHVLPLSVLISCLLLHWIWKFGFNHREICRFQKK